MAGKLWRHMFLVGALAGALALLAAACAEEAAPQVVEKQVVVEREVVKEVPVEVVVEKEVVREVEKEVVKEVVKELQFPPPGTYKWKFFLPFSGLWSTNQYPDLVKEIKVRTQGALEISVFAPGEHPYAFTDMLQAVDAGDAQMSEVLGGYSSGAEPRTAVLDLPLFAPTSDWKALFEVYDELLDGVWKPVFNEWGGQVVLAYSWPSQRLHTKQPAVTANSLKGQKLRTWNLELVTFVSMLGGEGVTIAWNEVPTALATGVVQGGVTGTGPATAAGWYDYVKYINRWEIQPATSNLFVNNKALAALDELTRETFLTVMDEWEDYLRYGTQWDDGLSTQNLILNWGAELVEPKPAFRAQLRERADPEIWQPWAKRVGGAAGAEMLTYVDNLIKEKTQ